VVGFTVIIVLEDVVGLTVAGDVRALRMVGFAVMKMLDVVVGFDVTDEVVVGFDVGAIVDVETIDFEVGANDLFVAITLPLGVADGLEVNIVGFRDGVVEMIDGLIVGNNRTIIVIENNLTLLQALFYIQNRS